MADCMMLHDKVRNGAKRCENMLPNVVFMELMTPGKRFGAPSFLALFLLD